MKLNRTIAPADLAKSLDGLFELAGEKALALDKSWDASRGTPVFTEAGKYTTRGWTEWTQGFVYGWAILAFDATDDARLLKLGRDRTVALMAPHVTHIGVHDHGFNNLSTYGNLRRLAREGRFDASGWELAFYEMAIKASGAVQAARWSDAIDEQGYVYSFNGPHSLFIDTMRTIRILGLAHQLGHVLMGENDKPISLLGRLLTHGVTTAKYNIYYGQGRDAYDIRGRTAHEAIFNRNDGRFRCPSSQQGYSAMTTWTRGLAWAMLGFAEELEFLEALPDRGFDDLDRIPFLRDRVMGTFEEAALATADFYLEHGSASDGIPYWDTGAPLLHKLGDYQGRPADPYNDFEPVDSSAAAIAAQGLIRLGNYLGDSGAKYRSAGLLIAQTLLSEPYLSTRREHQGLLLHSVYHRPNGWDYVAPGCKIPSGESSMWGDYHLLELALLIRRMANNQPYLTFFDKPIQLVRNP